MKRRFGIFQLLLLFLGGVVLMFILAPIAGMFFSVSSIQITETLSDKKVLDSIYLTLWTSMVSTLLFAIFSIPLAYILARKRFKLRGLILSIINIPVVIPHSAAGIAILAVISRDTIFGRFASFIGLDIIGNPAAIIIAMAFVSVPFLINSAIDAFSAVPERFENAALNLGASPARVFFSISLPLARRGIFTGMIMMWSRGMSEFGSVVIVAYYPMVTPVLMYERFASFGLKYATPVAIIFVVVILSFFVFMRLLQGQKN